MNDRRRTVPVSDGGVPRLPDALRKAPGRLPAVLATPGRSPFTFGYSLVLPAASLFAAAAPSAVVHSVLAATSTDVAHLTGTPLLALTGSALWTAGGMPLLSALGIILVLSALERRVGPGRTAGVFALGHVLATLATEIPVGLAVAAGYLPPTSLHRLDYGVSFGLMATLGALTGLVIRLVRWAVLAVTTAVLVQSLLTFTDPLTDWGHLIALGTGTGCWPLVRRAAPRGHTGTQNAQGRHRRPSPAWCALNP